ncbi:hypothetical protein C8039_02100 [Halogeometricum sp. wsp3]|nr:hypothetical protein C8039_02100 [Halogeometricum sp. wsp3]
MASARTHDTGVVDPTFRSLSRTVENGAGVDIQTATRAGTQHVWANDSIPAGTGPVSIDCSTETIAVNYTSDMPLTYDGSGTTDGPWVANPATTASCWASALFVGITRDTPDSFKNVWNMPSSYLRQLTPSRSRRW